MSCNKEPNDIGIWETLLSENDNSSSISNYPTSFGKNASSLWSSLSIVSIFMSLIYVEIDLILLFLASSFLIIGKLVQIGPSISVISLPQMSKTNKLSNLWW